MHSIDFKCIAYFNAIKTTLNSIKKKETCQTTSRTC